MKKMREEPPLPGRAASPPWRIVFTTFGSLGDVHPYIAMALGMKARGHESIVATSRRYQGKVESLGLGFHPIRPDSDFVDDPAAMRRFMDRRWGTVRIGVELVGPTMRDSYEDILRAADGADLLVSHPLPVYATRLVAEKTGIPWVSTMITPLGFLSAYDVPVVPVSPMLSRLLRRLGPRVAVPLLWLNKRATRFLAKPWYRIRSEIGLPTTDEGNPLLDSHSPRLVLALFSRRLADRQPDWPPQTVLTGFPVYDGDGQQDDLPAALEQFLADGPLPIIFTLSYSAATAAGEFFNHSIAAATMLNRRAVLIVGKQAAARLPRPLPPGIAAFDYAPFSKLFGRAAAIVHAAGIGTTGLVMHSGRPSLAVPYAHDQLDNAQRLGRLGVARVLSRYRYSPARVAAELRRLLDDPAYAARASHLAREISHENGVESACDAMERAMAVPGAT